MARRFCSFINTPTEDWPNARIDFTKKEMDWIETFSRMALAMENHSTCARVNVGAIVTVDNRVVSTGYNGVPSGVPHCTEVFDDVDLSTPENREKHGEFSRLYELHAEQNAIVFAGKSSIPIENGTLYTTVSPCSNCAKLIKSAGIKRVVYIRKYDRDISGIQILKEFGIECFGLEEFKKISNGSNYFNLEERKWNN